MGQEGWYTGKSRYDEDKPHFSTLFEKEIQRMIMDKSPFLDLIKKYPPPTKWQVLKRKWLNFFDRFPRAWSVLMGTDE